MPDVVVEGLHKQFAGQVALDDVNLSIRDGEFFTLLGPSGCGKSTTLACIAGLEVPDAGLIKVGEKVFFDQSRSVIVPPEERGLGMVFQSYALWPHMTVASNLALPLRLRSVGRTERRRQIADVLERVGLSDMSSRYPHELSGGQQQRVALARALVYSPGVLLLDEPLSNLDAKLRDRARSWLKQLQRDVGVTTVYVTHDQVEALALSDRVAVMGDGRMLQTGSPQEIYESPRSVAVADFVGRCNFIPARVAECSGGTLAVALGAEAHVLRLDVGGQELYESGQLVTVAVRAERLALTDDPAEGQPNVFPATVRLRSYVGSVYEYQVDVGGTGLQVTDARKFEIGRANLRFPAESCTVFPEKGASV